MQRRRQLMGMQTNELPNEYRRVEYLESNGYQYIMFPLKTINLADIGYETKFMFTTSMGGNRTFSSTRIGPWQTTQYSVNLGLTSYNRYKLVLTNEAGYMENGGTDVGYNIGDIARFSLHGDTLIYNGTAYTYARIITGQMSTQLALFGSVTGTSVSEIPAARCYYYRVFDSDEKVFDCIPCVRKLDSKPGMYDTVTKTFFTNTGSGEFIVPN